MQGAGSTGPGAGDSHDGSPADPGHESHTTIRLQHSTRLRRSLARLLARGADAATRWVIRLLGGTPAAGRAHFSEAELRDLVAASTVLDREERRLIDEVLAAGRRHVRELMVPRTEVMFLDAAMSVPRAVRLVRETRHSRFPVVDGDKDDVVGFVHLRDLLIRPEADAAGTVGELARELRRLPASKRVLLALSEMRREGDHLALVVDEYGGTAGIVTLEDLIEELVGEIHDEYDVVPEPGLLDGIAPSEVDGLLNLNDFAEHVGFALPPGPYDTVGGFVMARLGKLPALGDEVRVAASPAVGTPTMAGETRDEWRMSVVEMDGRRVARVALTPAPAVLRAMPEVIGPRYPVTAPASIQPHAATDAAADRA
jgi:putative hemolysin